MREISVFGHIVHHAVATYGYFAVFAFCTLEGFGFFFVPGEMTLITASIAAAGALTRAPHHLNIILVLAMAFCGALLGDNFSFWIGHRFGFGLLSRYGHCVKLNLKRLKYVQYLYLRHGYPIVFAGRFVMVLRAWESFLAGANAMPWQQFAPINAAAILVWVCVWGLGAYGIGQTSESVLKPLIVGIAVVICIILGFGWIYFRRHEDELEAKAEKALPGPLQARRQGSQGAAAAKAR